MVDWAVRRHRHACSVHSANRVILRNEDGTSSETTQRRRSQQRRDAAAVRSCRATFRWITLTAALHRLELDRSRTVERHRAHNEQFKCGCGGGFGMGYCAIASHHPPAAAASSARLESDASGENPTACTTRWMTVTAALFTSRLNRLFSHWRRTIRAIKH